ncbi:LysR family transcriptional regulator substrate-binding protein [Streptomyces sp. NPDC087849]|uniref:LysR family transcriptional regulator substrate-binding protein n=1 Tax=Streptomyces sp. NPDC087849 TaxID=3365808 RepID=UPI0037F659D4
MAAAATAATVRVFLAPFIATTGPDDPPLITRQAGHFALNDELLDEADFIVSPTPTPTPTPMVEGLETVDLGGTALKAHGAPDHRWAEEGRTETGLAEICGDRLFAHSRSSVSRAVLDNALGAAHLAPERLTECDDGPTAEALALAGHGIGISTDLPRYGAHALWITAAGAGPREMLRVPLHVAWLPGHFASDTIRTTAVRLRDFLVGQGDAVTPAPPQS